MDKNIIIITGAGLPEALGNNVEDGNQPDMIVVGEGVTFELRSIVLLRSHKSYNIDGNKYKSIRYMQHGGIYNKRWKQEQSDAIVTQCVSQTLFNTFMIVIGIQTWLMNVISYSMF